MLKLGLLLLLLLQQSSCTGTAAGQDATWEQPFGMDSFLVSSARGFRFALPRRDAYMSVLLRKYGQWEDPAMDFVSTYIAESGRLDNQSQGAIFLDLGSNIGTWSLMLSRLAGEEGVVYAFDAQLSMMNYLGTNLVLNSAKNVIPIHAIITYVMNDDSREEVEVTKEVKMDYDSTLLYHTEMSTVDLNHGCVSIDMLSKKVLHPYFVLKTHLLLSHLTFALVIYLISTYTY